MKLLLRETNYVDIRHRTIRPGTSVRVIDGVVAQVGADRDVVVAPGDEVVEGDGRYLLPGLIDAHVHINGEPHRGPTDADPVPGGPVAIETDRTRSEMLARLNGFLYCGVTSVYDAGNDQDRMYALRDDERAGRITAPRIFCTGAFVTTTGGHGSTLGSVTTIDSLPADLPRLQAHLARRPDLLKITYDEHNWGVRPLIPILSTELMSDIIFHAHQARIRVTVHVSNEVHAREAVACGADALAHPVIQSPVTEEFVWLLAAKGIPVATTLAIGERYFRLADDPSFLDDPLYRHCLSLPEREELSTAEHERQRSNRWADWMRVMTPVAQENLRRLATAGGVVAAGSDLSLGPDLHREMELLQAAGLDAWDVLRSATEHGARYLGRQDILGSVRSGYRADLILLDENPTHDISKMSSISMVMKSGTILDRTALRVTTTSPGQREPADD